MSTNFVPAAWRVSRQLYGAAGVGLWNGLLHESLFYVACLLTYLLIGLVVMVVCQVGKSSQCFSMLSLKDTHAAGSSNCSLAMYKGITVSVYSVDKPEVTLSRQDLIDLVNVRSPASSAFYCTGGGVEWDVFSGGETALRRHIMVWWQCLQV